MQYIIKNKSMKNYTQIHNELINNCKYSLDLLGFASVLLSKPPDWVINIYQLMNELKIGKDRVLRLLSALEKEGYIYKKTNVQFAKKGEQKNFYYMFDSKDILKETFPETDSNSNPQLPLIASTPVICSAHLGSPVVDYPVVDNTSYTNTYINTNKEITNKKNTKLTLHETLDRLVDKTTKNNILKAAPNLTLEAFEEIYKKMQLEYKKRYCTNFNAGLVLAVGGRWKFRANESVDSNERIIRIIKGNMNYCLSYFEESSDKPEEILLKFHQYCKKYDSELVNQYSEILKKELGI